MEFFGIKFAPLNIPIQRRMQTLSAFLTLMLFPILPTFGIIFTSYILFFTKYWIFGVAYLFWIWVIDKDTPEQGARRKEFLCNFKFYKYAQDYYPANLKLEKGIILDGKRNYLFCIFPHGVLAAGPFLTLFTNTEKLSELFPYHQINAITLTLGFKIPIFRDILLLMGGCSASTKSINYLLGNPDGGKIAALVVGGVEEALYARPGPYHVVLKNRKGFIKLALNNGSPLIPVFSFGEIELYDQVNNPKGSLVRKVQHWFKSKTTIAPIIISGRGFLQYSFGPVPRRKPITVVIGKPIEVQKNENPTQEEIDCLHSKFIEELRRLFDTHKHRYTENPKEATLVVC